MTRAASASEPDQCWFTRLSRKQPMKLPTNAFWMSLPGWIKRSRIRSARLGEATCRRIRPVIHGDLHRQLVLSGDLVKRTMRSPPIEKSGRGAALSRVASSTRHRQWKPRPIHKPSLSKSIDQRWLRHAGTVRRTRSRSGGRRRRTAPSILQQNVVNALATCRCDSAHEVRAIRHGRVPVAKRGPAVKVAGR